MTTVDLPAAGGQHAQVPGPPGRNSGAAKRRFPPFLLSKISPTRRIALVIVGLFEVSEVVLLWRRGLEHEDWIAAILGLIVLLLLLGFELVEHAATRRDHELSQEISEWLLPHTPPSIQGVEVAFSSRMANHVGSDYFNVFPRLASDRSHRVFVVMADVAGTGLQGALLMATFQASLRVLVDSSLTLCDLASEMNQWCWDRSLEGRHFTMAFLADYDPRTGTLDYVSAGHQPAAVSRVRGHLERLDVAGFPLGALADSQYELGSVLLDVGDTLVVFTDGVIKAENRWREQFGEERVLSVLRTGQTSANETLNRLKARMLSFCGSVRQPDDLSFIVLRRSA
jgi:sigma-B regulation protein RsbU (phosphoserine phosphatase)